MTHRPLLAFLGVISLTPAVEVAGCAMKTSCVTVPGVIVKGVLTMPVSPEDVAVRV